MVNNIFYYVVKITVFLILSVKLLTIFSFYYFSRIYGYFDTHMVSIISELKEKYWNEVSSVLDVSFVWVYCFLLRLLHYSLKWSYTVSLLQSLNTVAR